VSAGVAEEDSHLVVNLLRDSNGISRMISIRQAEEKRADSIIAAGKDKNSRSDLSRNPLEEFRIGVEGVILKGIVLLVLSDELGDFGEDVIDRFHHLQ